MIEAGSGHLYERAAPVVLAPLWHLDGHQTFFAGPLDYNAPHQHGAAVFLAGLYGRFRLRVAGGDWLSCRTAVIPAGVIHELDLGGDPLAVFYIEPQAGGAETFTPIVGGAREVGGALVGDSGEYATMRALFESADAGTVSPVLDDLLGFAKARAPAPDERLARALGLMHRCGETLVPATAIRCAAAAGLSPSRFQHLFSAQMKVPFRRYRAWMRMRRAIDAIVAGSNFTTAAHAAGFADQAHFAHDFRRTFGAPASRSLTGVRRGLARKL